VEPNDTSIRQQGARIDLVRLAECEGSVDKIGVPLSVFRMVHARDLFQGRLSTAVSNPSNRNTCGPRNFASGRVKFPTTDSSNALRFGQLFRLRLQSDLLLLCEAVIPGFVR